MGGRSLAKLGSTGRAYSILLATSRMPLTSTQSLSGAVAACVGQQNPAELFDDELLTYDDYDALDEGHSVVIDPFDFGPYCSPRGLPRLSVCASNSASSGRTTRRVGLVDRSVVWHLAVNSLVRANSGWPEISQDKGRGNVGLVLGLVLGWFGVLTAACLSREQPHQSPAPLPPPNRPLSHSSTIRRVIHEVEHSPSGIDCLAVELGLPEWIRAQMSHTAVPHGFVTVTVDELTITWAYSSVLARSARTRRSC